MFTYDCYTQTGINAAIKLNDQWSILFGIHAGDVIAPWNKAAHPTAMAMARWVSRSLRIAGGVAYASDPDGFWLWKFRRLWPGTKHEDGPDAGAGLGYR